MADEQAAPMQVYCVKCKAKTEQVKGVVVETKNKRKAMKGTCKDCGTTTMQFIKG